ncbi:HotDog domain-containing protein [Mrakia frigida]|uniref:PaaI family thioesterase n=1 Tax=Mrakia frigida TaxID=29902 RepID=UPI003FCBFEF3
MLSRSLLPRPSSRSSSVLLLQLPSRSYASPPNSPPPSMTTPPPSPPPPSDRDTSLPPLSSYTPPPPPSSTDKPKKVPLFASFLAQKMGIDIDEVKRQAAAQRALPPSEGGGAAYKKPSFKDSLKNAINSNARMGDILRKSREEAEKPRADGTFRDLTFMEKITPIKIEPYKQRKFEDIMSQRTSFILQGLVITGIWLLGVFYPPDFGTLLSPRRAPAGPAAESTAGRAVVKETETSLQELAVVKEYRKLVGWYECRPYTTLPDYAVAHSLTAGTLRGPSKLAIPPIVFAKEDESEALVVVHLGRSLCGHDGIVHGGMVATILDEATGRNALLNLPTKIGVTANLSVNYRAPTKADQFVVIKTKLVERKGRKAVVAAEMWSLSGDKLADATAVYVEPKWAALLSGSGVEELLGKKPEGITVKDAVGVKPSGLFL